MKRITASLSSLLILSALFTLNSCQKEEASNGTQFRASMEDCTSQNGKTTLSGTALNWVSGDQIAVYGTAGCGIYSATPQTPATTAVFDNVSGETGDPTFRAFYPTTLTTDGVNITLPATQTYVENSIHEFPMYAESSSNTLSFRNLCGALKLHLTANANISTIIITAASEINGTFSVNYNAGNPLLTPVSGTTTTTLTCATAQSIASGKDFFIYLPAGSYAGLRIELNTDDGRYCVKTANTTISVTRGQYTLITLNANNLQFRPTGSKGGLFTINADGDQVWFSQGNLQYRASTNTWRFAEQQYDCVGADNANISTTYAGWIDLFGWGTGNNPTSRSSNDYDYGTFVDWGVNAISNGGNVSNTWRTLSQAEWSYLVNNRTNSTNLATANARYAMGSVNGKFGLILFPDGYSHPTGIAAPVAINSSTGWSSNSYTIGQWGEMEANGAIFLPAAGDRTSSVAYVGSAGHCWSSTPNTGDLARAYSMFFNANNQTSARRNNYRHDGFSVRLVRDNE